MITPPRSLRYGAALVGVVGTIALAGCSAASTTTSANTGTAGGSSSTPAEGSAGGSSAGTYADGTYSAEGSYSTPESVETVSVTVTVADNVVTAVTVTGDPQARESQQYQSQFIGGISNEVVGKKLDQISVSRVAGSSLTSGGFMQALEKIKSEAAS